MAPRSLLLLFLPLACFAQATQETTPPDVQAYNEARRAKTPSEKIALYEKFLTDHPDSGRAGTARESLLEEMFTEDPARATSRTEQFEKELGRFPSAALWRLLATRQMEAGKDFAAAESAIRRALENHTLEGYMTEERRDAESQKRPVLSEGRLRTSFNMTRAGMLETLSESCLKQEKLEAAAGAAREALELNKASGKAAQTLATLLERQGQPAEALSFSAHGYLARPSKQSRQSFQSLYSKVNGAAGNPEEYLDQAYHRLFPPPIHATPYKKSAQRSDRVVLAEVYTGAGCPPCVAADLAFDAVLERYSRSDVAVVMFHEHIPRPDPMTNEDTVARWNWLKGRGVPAYNIDGKYGGGGGPREGAGEIEEKNRPLIEGQLGKRALAVLQLNAAHKGGEVRVSASAAELKQQSASLELHVVLVEKVIRYSGENGIRFHPMVARSHAAFPLNGDSGISKEHVFDLAQVNSALKRHLDEFEKHNERHNKDGNFRFLARPDTVDAGNLAVVAWLQDMTTREVYQAAYTEAPLKP